MESTLNDLKFALRQLRRSPAFALTAVLTLALGIGANTAIFSLLDQALLRSLPVRDPASLVVLEGTGDAWEGNTSNHGGEIAAYFSYPMYRDLRDHGRGLDGLVATSPADIGFARAGVSQLGQAELVSGNYFTLLGVQPSLGRVLTQTDDLQKDASPVVVLGYDFWKNHVGADPRVVGSTVSINGKPFEVVGVAAEGFRSAIWGQTPSLFIPMAMTGQIVTGKEDRLSAHTARWLNIIGRLPQGESREQAEAAMAPLWHALRSEELKAIGTRSRYFTDEFLTKSRLHILPGARGFSYNRDEYQRPLLVVMAMAVLVLIIASVNVASLLLVRSASRVREFSLRFALGASGRRLLRQLLLEGALIGLAGGLAGMLIAPIVIRMLVHRIAGEEAYGSFNSTIDARLLFFNFAIALGVSVVFSLAPALQLRRPNLTEAMGQRSGTNSGAMLSFRRAVVCLQIGLSVLLLVGAGLFVRTMQKLRTVDVGFKTEHLVTFGINPKLAGYAPAVIPALQQRVLDTLGALPGVQSVAVTDDPELAGFGQNGDVSVSGYVAPPDEDFSVEDTRVNPSFFSTMRVPMVVGRMFTEADDVDHPRVAIVNEAFVRHVCGTPQSCIGRHVARGRAGNPQLNIEIVGVVRDSKHTGIRDEAAATMFRPLRQESARDSLYFYLRTATDPAQALPTVRRSMQLIDPTLALSRLRTMDQQIDDNLSNERMITLLAVSFGVLATLLAGVGLYGVLAYTTAQRTREIGIRIALGSSRLAVSRVIVMEVLRLAGIGILASLPIVFGLSRLLGSQLYGVSPTDPLAIAVAVLLIALVSMIAALVPARRAASVNPVAALRTE